MRLHSTGDRLRHRLVEVRNRRGLSQAQLSKRLQVVGVTLHPTAITKIEAGKRAVTIEEVFALAYVLNISPTNLLLPVDDEAPVEITPRSEHLAIWVRDWINGIGPLPPDADRLYADAVADYFREAPEREQRARRADGHPLMVQIDGSLKLFAREAVLFTQGVPLQDPASSPQLLAEALREAARRVSAYAGLLADELERSPTTEPTKRGRSNGPR